MSTLKWATPEAIQTAMTTGLNSLGNGNTAIGSSIDNSSDLYMYIALEVVLPSITTGAGAPSIDVWCLSSADGTNYEDGSAGTPGVIPDRPPDASFALKPSSTSAWRRVIVNVPIPPVKFDLLLMNNSGVALAASANTLKYSRYNLQTV